jgi:hypothetical protein
VCLHPSVFLTSQADSVSGICSPVLAGHSRAPSAVRSCCPPGPSPGGEFEPVVVVRADRPFCLPAREPTQEFTGREDAHVSSLQLGQIGIA